MNNFFDNQRILTIIWRRKVHFVIIGIIAVILAAFFSSSMFITPKFKSTARIYPTNLWTLSNESETEQMLEIVNSRDIKIRMFDAFGLDSVYEIHKDDPKYMTYMIDLYNTHVGSSKTEFETVEIKVLDKNPKRASDMCDSIIHFYNQKVRGLHAKKAWEMVEITKKGLEEKYHEIDSVSILLDEQRGKYGILGYGSQAEEITRGYMEALANNRSGTADGKKIKALYDNLQEAGSKSYFLEKRLEQLIDVVDSLDIQLGIMKVEATKNITYSHVVEYPIPADKKSYPVRWLIVFVSLFSSLFISLLAFLVIDYRKEE